MLIYQWSGTGRAMMAGVSEYIMMFEDEEDFTDDYKDEQEAIEAHTAPGFGFERKYDTDTDTDFCGLPLERMLASRF